jgi:hypothetical protein
MFSQNKISLTINTLTVYSTDKPRVYGIRVEYLCKDVHKNEQCIEIIQHGKWIEDEDIKKDKYVKSYTKEQSVVYEGVSIRHIHAIHGISLNIKNKDNQTFGIQDGNNRTYNGEPIAFIGYAKEGYGKDYDVNSTGVYTYIEDKYQSPQFFDKKNWTDNISE